LDVPVDYNGTSGGVAERSNNSIWLMACSSIDETELHPTPSTTDTDRFRLRFHSRIRYYDA
jgi:hypothetical protein